MGPPQGGHIAKMEFKRRLDKDSEARETFERQVREEQERRRAQREVLFLSETIFGTTQNTIIIATFVGFEDRQESCPKQSKDL